VPRACLRRSDHKENLLAIKDWPPGERPRERLCQKGPDALSDAELLAVLLANGSATGHLTALDCARLLLGAHTDFRTLVHVPFGDLLSVPGLGPAKASRIQAALEIGRRMAVQKRQAGRAFQRSQDVFDAYSLVFRDEKREVFTVLLLDSKNRFLREERVSMGSLNYSLVHPREVFHAAIRGSASALILLHNHPSGDPTPSQEDIDLTERLEKGGRLLGIQILDHIVLGEGRYHSFCDNGWMERDRYAK
jgi:DNA repair protein RadC